MERVVTRALCTHYRKRVYHKSNLLSLSTLVKGGSWLVSSRRIVLLFTLSLTVKLVCFIIGVMDGRVFDIEPLVLDVFAFGEVEAWRDYGLAYLPTIEAFKSGYTPYVDFWYAYPPLFLYLLAAFSYLPLQFWGPAIPIVVFDVLSTILVFLIGSRFLSQKESFIATLLFIMAPINLFYNDYLWLNPPLVTLPSLLATFFFLTKKYDLSALSLAIAFGFKQTGLILFPVLSVGMYKKIGPRKALRFIAIFISSVVAISIPYLFTSPQHYLWCLSGQRIGSVGSLGEEYWSRILPWATGITVPPPSYPIHGNGPINLAVPIFVFTSQGMEGERLFTYFWDFKWAASIGLSFALFASFILLLWRFSRLEKLEDYDVVCHLLISLILFNSFYERGIFKYYLATVTPFLVLAIRNRLQLALFILFNFSTLIVPRYLSSWILLPFLLHILLRILYCRIHARDASNPRCQKHYTT